MSFDPSDPLQWIIIVMLLAAVASLGSIVLLCCGVLQWSWWWLALYIPACVIGFTLGMFFFLEAGMRD